MRSHSTFGVPCKHGAGDRVLRHLLGRVGRPSRHGGQCRQGDTQRRGLQGRCAQRTPTAAHEGFFRRQRAGGVAAGGHEVITDNRRTPVDGRSHQPRGCK